ncbi:unnamed protein product [Moneuplotes crassus]|uniref:Uncharacterized protein n=1 Tax=Euplotes crassus TaxID=5936 RepID=A0AAD2D3G3_EUPCR|nr:unnamed protein product [Moneuplotes crassus]
MHRLMQKLGPALFTKINSIEVYFPVRHKDPKFRMAPLRSQATTLEFAPYTPRQMHRVRIHCRDKVKLHSWKLDSNIARVLCTSRVSATSALSVQIECMNVSRRILKRVIVSCRHLVGIYFNSCHIHTEGFRIPEHLEFNLRSITFYNSKFPNSVTSMLAGIAMCKLKTQIKRISFSDCDINFDKVKEEMKFYSLENINLSTSIYY